MKAFYLEPDEEITSVIDRLKTIDEREVAIVIPKRAGLLQSIINLKLLKQQGERQHKELSIITTDKTGRNLASAVGLTVYQKLPKGGEVSAPAPAAPVAEVPIELRKRPPADQAAKRTVSPGISDIGYKAGNEPKLNTHPVPEEPTVPLAEAAAGQPEAEPKTEPEAEPTAASETDAVPGPTPEKTASRGFLRRGRKQPSAPAPPLTGAPEPNPAASQPGPAASKAGSPVPEPTPAVPQPAPEPVQPRPERQAGRLHSFKVPLLRLPKLRLPRLGKKSGAAGLAGALVVLLAGGGVAAAVVLPKAQITVTPKTAPLATEVPLNFSTRATTTDTAGNVIPAKVVEVIKQTSTQATATGPQTEGGNRATGTITVTNNLRRNQSLVAQTRFQAPDGSIYRIASRLVLPAGGQAKATVTAAAAGEAGNLPAGTALTVPGLGGGGGVTATTADAFSGGSSGQGTVVSRDDVERAKAELATQAAKEGLEEARGKLAVGFKIEEQAMVPTVLSANPEPALGTTAPTFTIAGQVRISYFTYEDAEAQRVLKEDLQTKIPAGSDLVEESIQQTFVATQTSADTLGGVIRINTLTAPEISREQIKSDVAGQIPAEAESTLRASGKLDNVLVTLSPFWVRTVPDSAKKVDVRYQINGGAPPPSPSAPPSAAPSPVPSTDPAATPLPSLPPSL